MSAAATAVTRGKRTVAEIFAGAHARTEAALARMEVAAANEFASAPAVYAPQSEGDRAAAPAALLWGSLFAALPRGPRATLKLACLAQAGMLSLHYTGERLGQDDLDVFLALLHLAQNQPLGAGVHIAGGELLSELGLQDSGGQARVDGGAGARDRLEASLRRLAGALIELRGERGEVLMGHLVDSARRGRHGEAWRVTLARELAPAFGHALAGVDLRVRRALRGKPLAGWLHAWLSSHGGQPKPHRLDTLRSLCGSTSAPKEFRRKLERALVALESAERDAGSGLSWSIGDGSLTIHRGASRGLEATQ